MRFVQDDRVVINGVDCERGRMSDRAVRRVWGGLAAFLVVTLGAVGAEIASDDAPTTPAASVEDYAPYSGEQLPMTPLADPLRLKREALEHDLAVAEDRVWFDGSPETVIVCNAAVVALNKVRAVKTEGQCTPPGTEVTNAP